MKKTIQLVFIISLFHLSVLGQGRHEFFGFKITEGWMAITGQDFVAYDLGKMQAEESGSYIAWAFANEELIDVELKQIGLDAAFAGFPFVSTTQEIRDIVPVILQVSKKFKSEDEFNKLSSIMYDELVEYATREFGAFDQVVKKDTIQATVWNNVSYVVAVRRFADKLEVEISYLSNGQ